MEKLYLVASILLFTVASVPALAHHGRCEGSANCRVCTNCSRCAHCKSGGSCGVCSGTSLGRGFSSSSEASGRSRSRTTYIPQVTRPAKPRPTPQPTPAPLPTQFTGKVVAIADGDTMTVLTASKRQVKIRLHGVDAPEKAQPFGQKAKQVLAD